MDEYNHVVDSLKEWKNNGVRVERRWYDIFKILEGQNKSINDFWQVVKYSLVMPITNTVI